MRTLKVLLPLAVHRRPRGDARRQHGARGRRRPRDSRQQAVDRDGVRRPDHGRTTQERGRVRHSSARASGAGNVQLDCDDPFPNNEPHIAVDPANPLHMIASSNDYGSCCDEWYTTFDGGATWATGNMSTGAGRPTGSDPVTSFDTKHHVALHASLNYFFNDDFTRDLRRRRRRIAVQGRRAEVGSAGGRRRRRRLRPRQEAALRRQGMDLDRQQQALEVLRADVPDVDAVRVAQRRVRAVADLRVALGRRRQALVRRRRRSPARARISAPSRPQVTTASATKTRSRCRRSRPTERSTSRS